MHLIMENIQYISCPVILIGLAFLYIQSFPVPCIYFFFFFNFSSIVIFANELQRYSSNNFDLLFSLLYYCYWFYVSMFPWILNSHIISYLPQYYPRAYALVQVVWDARHPITHSPAVDYRKLTHRPPPLVPAMIIVYQWQHLVCFPCLWGI